MSLEYGDVKPGDFVECIKDFINDNEESVLTLKKKYKVVSVNNLFIRVINDKRDLGGYHYDRFKLVIDNKIDYFAITKSVIND